jgi:hypothetical protein
MHLVVSSKTARSSVVWIAPCRIVALGDEEGHHVAVGVEERLHVDDEVLLERQALDRFDGRRAS